MSAGPDQAITVTGLAIAPIKGTQLRTVDRVVIDPAGGVRENRRFYLIDDRGRMLNGKQLGQLHTIRADYSDHDRRLAITFPGGRRLEGEIATGESIQTRFFSGLRTGQLVTGPWAQALSEHLGQSIRLVEAEPELGAVDRGARGGAVSLISRESLARLADVAAEPRVDGRRFRMLIEIGGVTAHEEDRWVGRQVRVGESLLRFNGHVGRCLITSRDPETGEIDLPTLEHLGSYRRELPSTEPLPFGVYGEVLRAGTVRVGDAVVVVSPA